MKKVFFFSVFLFFQIKAENCLQNNYCPQTEEFFLYNIKTIFIPISAGANLYTQYHKPLDSSNEIECYSSNLSITYRFQRTNNSNDIAKLILQYNPLVFQGELGTINNPDFNRLNNRSLISTYFGMPSDADFSLCFSPVIQNQIIDLQFSFGKNIWIQFNVPIIYSSWRMDPGDINGYYGNINLQNNAELVFITDSTSGQLEIDNINQETAIDVNSVDIVNNEIVESNFTDYSNLLDNSTSIQNVGIGYFSSCVSNSEFEEIINEPGQDYILYLDKITPAKNVYQSLNGYTFGNLNERLYNKFFIYDYQYHSTQAFWGVSDLFIQLGYDFINNENRHVGVYLKGIIPTGNEIDQSWAEYIFTPVIGNGRHFELGVGISVHNLFILECENKIKLCLDGYITHPFSNCQFRSFDKTNLPMSRYAIVKKLINTNNNIVNPLNDQYYYNYNLSALGDINAFNTTVNIKIRGEAILDIIYEANNYNAGIGYAFSGQTQEYPSGYCQINKCSNELSLKSDCYCNILDSSLCYGYKSNSFENNLVFSNTPANGTNWIIADNIEYIGIKSNNEVSDNINSGCYIYNNSISEASSENTFSLPNINRSGFMNGQILQRIFGHFDYFFVNISCNPFIGIIGSYGFTPSKYITAAYYDLGFRLGFSF